MSKIWEPECGHSWGEHDSVLMCLVCEQRRVEELARYRRALEGAKAYILTETDKEWRESSPLCRIILEALGGDVIE